MFSSSLPYAHQYLTCPPKELNTAAAARNLNLLQNRKPICSTILEAPAAGRIKGLIPPLFDSSIVLVLVVVLVLDVIGSE